tara:strand:- start:108 stop:1331 length:1224 start_codon:yes stop_codon:yes gene_type:complete
MDRTDEIRSSVQFLPLHFEGDSNGCGEFKRRCCRNNKCRFVNGYRNLSVKECLNRKNHILDVQPTRPFHKTFFNFKPILEHLNIEDNMLLEPYHTQMALRHYADFYFIDDLYHQSGEIIYHNLTRNGEKIAIDGLKFSANKEIYNVELSSCNIDLSKLFDGCWIMMNNHFLNFFIKQIMPHINNKINLLIQSNDDNTGTNIMELLNNDNVLKIGSYNWDIRHPKIIHMPIGLADWRLRPTKVFVPHADQLLLSKYAHKILPLEQRKHFKRICVNFHFNVDKYGGRKKCIHAINTNTELKDLCIFSKTRQTFEDYVKNVSEFGFCLSPRGNGIDCHRTWECLVLGVIPIVKTSTIDDVFKDLPVIIVNNWNEITPNLLDNFIKTGIHNTNYKYRLTQDYWSKLIRNNL